MDPLQVIAHEAAMRHRSRLHSALPDAPVVPDRPRPRPRIPKTRARLAATLRAAATKLDPDTHPRRPTPGLQPRPNR
ncbi:hypothetical protein [Spongiactinospora sp. 9N601]|uniref:hypothetical protein n=1 Tax=Spongiactinospora sp. 9N601 TaxID=3375149 RepID=UPI00378B51D3